MTRFTKVFFYLKDMYFYFYDTSYSAQTLQMQIKLLNNLIIINIDYFYSWIILKYIPRSTDNHVYKQHVN